MDDMRYEKYICSKCGAEDTVALFPHESKPAVINCWKCHAGYQKSVDEMLLHDLGMFPLTPPARNMAARR